MIATVIVAVLNALGALLPQLPALIDSVRGHPQLSEDGKKALDLIDARLAEHERKLAAVKPLPVPDPAPTPTSPGGG